MRMYRYTIHCLNSAGDKRAGATVVARVRIDYGAIFHTTVPSPPALPTHSHVTTTPKTKHVQHT